MFLSQVVMHNGFYDDNLEFVQIEHIQIEPSMAPLGRHPLAARLKANLRVCAISYPTMEELIEVYSQMVVVHSHIFRNRLMGAESQGHVDSMLRTQ